MAIDNSLSKKSLTQIFNESAERYREAFPEQLKKLLVTSTTRPIYISPEIVDLLTGKMKALTETILDLGKQMRAKSTLAAVGVGVRISDEPITLLAINTETTATPFVTDKYPQEMNLVTLFDHEMGHLVVKEGGDTFTPHIAECAADAYAVLRHLQRFGDMTDILECAAYNIAEHAIVQSIIHYSSAAIQRVAQIQKDGKIDIQSLSLQETAKLAGDIGLQYSFSEETLKKIHDAYAPARRRYNLRNPREFIEEVAEVMYQHRNDHDIYRAGKLYLNRPDVKQTLSRIKRGDPSFSDIFNFMEQHEKDSGFILDAAAAMDAQRPAIPEPAPAAAEKPPAPKSGEPRIGLNLNRYC